MDKDIISQTLINDSTAGIIRKIYKIALVLLILNILYALLDIADWYSLLTHLSLTARRSVHFVYFYKIRPIIAIISLSISIMSSVLIYNAYGFMIHAIENEDSLLINKAFKNIYYTYLLALASFPMAIVSLIYRVVIYS